MDQLLSRIKQAMREHGISAQDIADRTGMERATINKQLNGHYKLNALVLLTLVRLCSVSADWLLLGVGSRTRVPEDRLDSIDAKLDQLLSKMVEPPHDGTREGS